LTALAGLGAVAALRSAGFDLNEEVIARGLRQVQWPARFQRIGASLVIDGAHNPDAARVLVETWREQFPQQQAQVVFGGVAGKDTAAVLRELEPITGSLAFTPIDSPRTLSADKLREIWDSLSFPARPVTTHASIAAALESTENTHPVLIAGSLYLAGEALALIENKPHSFERSAQ